MAKTYAFVVRDRAIGAHNATYVDSLEKLKAVLMSKHKHKEDWTIVIAIHGSIDRLGAQSPPNWQKNAIFYDKQKIQSLFSGTKWDQWRKKYGPSQLVLIGCQVGADFQRTIIKSITKDGKQKVQGLGTHCVPGSHFMIIMDVDSEREFKKLSRLDKQEFFKQLRELNNTYGYYGGKPVDPDTDTMLKWHYFNGGEVGWIVVDVEIKKDGSHTTSETGKPFGIPFWNRSGNEKFRRICDEGVGQLRKRESSVPEVPE